MDIESADTWACHIHHSADCKMKNFRGHFYHVKPIKDISAYSQANFNSQNVPEEFWEDFDQVLYVSPIAYASNAYKEEIFRSIMKIFYTLDSSYLKYATMNKPSDFVKKHLVTDGGRNIILCHKHLIRQCKRKDKKPQTYYTRNSWIRLILKSLFPKIEGSKTIPTNTPQWAMSYMNKAFTT